MRASVSQLQLLVECMERNGDLSKRTEGPQGSMNKIQCWALLAEILNADSTGETKSVKKWRKVWSDLKTNTRKKYVRIHRDGTGTGGGSSRKDKLTDFQERVLNFVGSRAATGVPDIGVVGLSQEDIQPILTSIQVHSEVPEATENTLAMGSLAGISASAQPFQLPEDEIEPPSSCGSNVQLTERQVPYWEPDVQFVQSPPIPEAPTHLPATPRRRRRLDQTMRSPTRRRTRTQTESELARQALVNSDNEWRVFQQKCEEERLRLRERELNQQERWLDVMSQFVGLGNRIVDIYQNLIEINVVS